MTYTLTKRNSAMELLRIIAMFLIIFSHYINHGTNLVFNNTPNGISAALFNSGNVGTAIFVLISGYFLINSKFNFKKVFSLITQVVFYSIVIYVLCITFKIKTFSIKNAITSVFPTSFSLYWFFTTYIVMYLLSPFINKFLNSITKETHLKVILATAFLWIIMPTATTLNFAGNDLTLFFTLYTIGAYLRKYPDNILSKNNHDTVVIVLCSLMLAFFVIAVIFLFPSFAEYSTYLHSRNSIAVIALAVALVSFFSRIKPFYSKVLNTISGTTFGVYLIHDNRFFREFMWREIFLTAKYESHELMLIHMLVCSIIIFAVCFAIEFARKKFIERPVLIIFDKLYVKFNPKFTLLQNKILKQ